MKMHLSRVEKYIDDALLASYPRVSIIHGKGTGALRTGVQEYLKNHRSVKIFVLVKQVKAEQVLRLWNLNKGRYSGTQQAKWLVLLGVVTMEKIWENEYVYIAAYYSVVILDDCFFSHF